MPLPENPTTKEKIFFAAIKVFAEKGFKEATVRDICKLADSANLNAVNYYYGGKAKLYECILEMMFAEELQHRWDNDELLQSDKASPHEKLMAYIRLHCALAYDEAEIVRDLNAIFIREMSRPSEFVKDLAKKANKTPGRGSDVHSAGDIGRQHSRIRFERLPGQHHRPNNLLPLHLAHIPCRLSRPSRHAGLSGAFGKTHLPFRVGWLGGNEKGLGGW